MKRKKFMQSGTFTGASLLIGSYWTIWVIDHLVPESQSIHSGTP